MTEGVLRAALGAADLFFAVLFCISVTRIHAWRNPTTGRPQVHHAYYGAVLIACWWLPAFVLGGFLLADDATQHFIQWMEQDEGHTGTPWRSPLHRLYDWVYGHLPLAVRAWLDRF